MIEILSFHHALIFLLIPIKAVWPIDYSIFQVTLALCQKPSIKSI
jgi:hypothetical protein